MTTCVGREKHKITDMEIQFLDPSVPKKLNFSQRLYSVMAKVEATKAPIGPSHGLCTNYFSVYVHKKSHDAYSPIVVVCVPKGSLKLYPDNTYFEYLFSAQKNEQETLEFADALLVSSGLQMKERQRGVVSSPRIMDTFPMHSFYLNTKMENNDLAIVYIPHKNIACKFIYR